VSANVRLGGHCLSGRGDDQSRFYLELPSRLSNLRLVRAMFGAWLERTGASAGEHFEIVLAAHEACANAIEHPEHPRRGVFELSARRLGQAIWLTVHDHGQWRAARSEHLRGRGLELIRELMDIVDIQPSDLGTTVLMARRIGRPAPERQADRLLSGRPD
jgi:anti-sigma regulatory factor (Ser/Thr protein kinase)